MWHLLFFLNDNTMLFIVVAKLPTRTDFKNAREKTTFKNTHTHTRVFGAKNLSGSRFVHKGMPPLSTSLDPKGSIMGGSTMVCQGSFFSWGAFGAFVPHYKSRNFFLARLKKTLGSIMGSWGSTKGGALYHKEARCCCLDAFWMFQDN